MFYVAVLVQRFLDAVCIFAIRSSTKSQPRYCVELLREQPLVFLRPREVDVDLIVSRRRCLRSITAVVVKFYLRTLRMVPVLGVRMTSR